jgi:hypothetical protein
LSPILFNLVVDMLALLICRANEDGQIVSPSQTAFIPGRNIMEGVVVLHEMIHEIYMKKDEWGNIENRF